MASWCGLVNTQIAFLVSLFGFTQPIAGIGWVGYSEKSQAHTHTHTRFCVSTLGATGCIVGRYVATVGWVGMVKPKSSSAHGFVCQF